MHTALQDLKILIFVNLLISYGVHDITSTAKLQLHPYGFYKSSVDLKGVSSEPHNL